MNTPPRPLTISEYVASSNGGAYARELKPDIKPILLGWNPSSRGEWQLTDQHRAILRLTRFLMDPAENTAPSLDPIRPFGTPNPLGDIGDATGVRSWEGVAQLYCEAQAMIPLFFQHARLAPGKYQISNLSMRELTWLVGDPSQPVDAKLAQIGFDRERRFKFTGSHLALIRSANWRWIGWSEEVASESKIWPVVFIDAKRTYSVQLLQQNCGWTADPDEHGHHRMSEEQRRMVMTLHPQLLPACQVFIEHAELENGVYSLRF
jgi:hypothetical protein